MTSDDRAQSTAIKKHKDPVIVFDSYPELPSIKDVTSASNKRNCFAEHKFHPYYALQNSPLQSNIEGGTLDNSYLNTSAVFSKRPLAAVVKR
jgi:hypothetical protein